MNRVLFVATVDEHIRHFHLPFLQWFQAQGYEVHVAAGGEEQLSYCDVKHNLSFRRSPFSAQNIRAARQLRRILRQYDFRLVHFHTPVASVFGRWAARSARRRGTLVLYTAHGFHFFAGAPLKNWLLFYPAERLMARYTDGLLVMNSEDYSRARSFPVEVHKVHGVGVDLARFTPGPDRSAARAALDIAADTLVILSVGELSPRKNHQLLLKALSKIRSEDIICLIAGQGDEEGRLHRLACELGLADNVRLLGYVKDPAPLYAAADIFCFPSLQEGLPVALMEAMAAGLPCVASDIRGNRDVIQADADGLLFGLGEGAAESCALGLGRLADDARLRRSMGAAAAHSVQRFGREAVMAEMTEIYTSYLEDRE